MAQSSIASKLANLPALPKPALPTRNLADQPNPVATSDPLLSLSPEEILEALRQADVVPSTATDQHTNAITQGITNASATERAFGVRAATVGSRARAWYAEIGAWSWPDSFVATGADPARADEGLVREGSLPADVVVQREARVEAIRDELEALDVEELKDFVRSAHLLPSSRASSLFELDITAPSMVRYLDDFTALITGTILMALPYLHRLNRLLDLWSMRLLVLHYVPSFLELLWSSRTAVDSAWNAVRPGDATTMENSSLSWDAYKTMQVVLGSRVTQLARTIDLMLDTLEGHQDRLPDEWIDLMEAVQADYEEWVIVAERLAEEHTWRTEDLLPEKKVEPEPQVQEKEVEPEPPMPEKEVKPEPPAQKKEVESQPPVQAKEVESQPQAQEQIMRALDLATASSVIPYEQETAQIKAHTSLAGATFKQNPPADATVIASRYRPMSLPVGSPIFPQNGQAPALETWKTSHPALFMPPRQEPPARPSPQTASEAPKALLPVKETSDKESETGPKTPSPPHSASSESYVSDISEPQVLDASPMQLTAYSPTRATMPPEYFLRRNSEQTDGSRSTVRGSVDFGESNDSSRTGSSLDQHISLQEALPQSRVRSALMKKAESDIPVVAEKTESGSVNTVIAGERESVAVNVVATKENESETANKVVAEKEPDLYEEDSDDESVMSPLREPQTLEEQLANRIRTILTHIPARIRLTSHRNRALPDAKQSTVSSQMRSASGPTLASQQSRSKTPAMTLAPAFEKATPKVYSGNSDIKVYHLYQPDREKPIKLYVRLVGEDERVMVRVGGGWADLGEYLKDYAVHHGRRSASDAKFEPKGLVEITPSNSRPSTPTHAGTSPLGGYSDSPPGNLLPALSNRKVRAPSGLSATPKTPDMMQRHTDALAPGDPGSSSGSRRTASRRVASSGSMLEDDSVLGLGGVKRNVELSPTKQAWVDGMLSQASRQTSSEKKSSGFGDIGKAGSTRRLFMRGKGGDG